MTPSTPRSKFKRLERDTICRNRFFYAYDHRRSTSFNALCKLNGIDIPPSAGRLWLHRRDIHGSKCFKVDETTPKVSEAYNIYCILRRDITNFITYSMTFPAITPKRKLGSYVARYEACKIQH
jgi:hypothetical protein